MRTRGVQPQPRHRNAEGMRPEDADAGALTMGGQIQCGAGYDGGETLGGREVGKQYVIDLDGKAGRYG